MGYYSMGDIPECIRIMEHEPREGSHLMKSEKSTPPLPKALKFLTAFPNSFWQIVTTIQVEKKNILKNQAEKRKSPHKSQVPSEQGRGMNLLQDTSVSEADAVEQREAHILHSRL